MKTTILQRPGKHTARDFNVNLENALSDLRGELSASTRLDGFSKKGWARIEVDGQDHEILLELIARELGHAQIDIDNIEMHGIYQGIVVGRSTNRVEVDIGLERPKPLNATIQLSTLRAQLADGKPLRCEEIVYNYCLFPSAKTLIRITQLEPESGIIEGWFADSQVREFSDWVARRLDRIQVPDSYKHEIELAIQRAHLERDVVSVESITLTVQSVLCKLGTDAIGLIPKLGSVLKGRELKLFVPKRILAKCRLW